MSPTPTWFTLYIQFDIYSCSFENLNVRLARCFKNPYICCLCLFDAQFWSSMSISFHFYVVKNYYFWVVSAETSVYLMPALVPSEIVLFELALCSENPKICCSCSFDAHKLMLELSRCLEIWCSSIHYINYALYLPKISFHGVSDRPKV